MTAISQSSENPQHQRTDLPLSAASLKALEFFCDRARKEGTNENVSELRHFLETFQAGVSPWPSHNNYYSFVDHRDAVQELLDSAELTLVQVLRLGVYFKGVGDLRDPAQSARSKQFRLMVRGDASYEAILKEMDAHDSEDSDKRSHLEWPLLEILRWFKRHQAPDLGLRDVAKAFHAIGFDELIVLRAMLFERSHLGGVALRWRDEDLWPYFAEHLDYLQRALEPTGFSKFDHPRRCRRVIDCVCSFPEVPAQFAELIWHHALGKQEPVRSYARKALCRNSQLEKELISLLADKKKERRVAAAAWLAERKVESAKNAMIAAYQKEKDEIAKSALLDSLERIGLDLSMFLDPAALQAGAESEKEKKLPEWLDAAALPRLSWKTGEPISGAIITWWLAQAYKRKSAEPWGLLRKYFERIEDSGKERFALALLERWIVEDTKGALGKAEAMEKAKERIAEKRAANPQAFQSSLLSEADYIRNAYQALRTPDGSATESSGVLALSGAAGSAETVHVANEYIHDWYGQRTAQCKHLVQMLGAIDHPTAVQALGAIAHQFRTATIKKEAEKTLVSRAERLGWTLDELSDRTIPSAGLDDSGVFRFADESGSIEAEIRENGALEVLPGSQNGDGGTALSETLQSALSAAQKEAKATLKAQQVRLSSAMCAGREWELGDLKARLFAHPIVRFLCERIIWGVVRDGVFEELFILKRDGSLLTVTGSTFDPPLSHRIRIAHSAVCSEESSAACRAFLKKQKIKPLLDQFSAEPLRLADDELQRDALEDFHGVELPLTTLAKGLAKRGYDYGQTDDGYRSSLVRTFRELGLEARVNFSATRAGSEDEPVLVDRLFFLKKSASGEEVQDDEQLVLADVPPIVLCECWNDLKSVCGKR